MSDQNTHQHELQENLPWVAYTLLSADQCSVTHLYQRQGDQLVCISGEWEPDEPNDHTDFVSVEAHAADGSLLRAGEISGDQHRDLECFDDLDAFIEAVLDGENIEEAAERLVAETASPV